MPLSSSFSRRRTPAFATSSLAAALLLAAASSASAATFSGSGALTTDYVWRGATQTQGDPAVQAGFKAAADNGLYGAISRIQRARLLTRLRCRNTMGLPQRREDKDDVGRIEKNFHGKRAASGNRAGVCFRAFA